MAAAPSAKGKRLPSFEGQQTGGHDLPSSAETAAEDLRASIERLVREIFSAAEGRALEIERNAFAEKDQVELGMEQGANVEILQAELGRAWGILGGIEELETRVLELVGALKTETEALVNGLESKLGTATDTDRRAEQDGVEDGHSGNPHTANEADGLGREPETERSNPHPELDFRGGRGNFEVEQMIFDQVVMMFRDGKPRSEAESFLTRFKHGEDYLQIIDEVYTQSRQSPPTRRRGGLLRRRNR